MVVLQILSGAILGVGIGSILKREKGGLAIFLIGAAAIFATHYFK